MLEMFFALLIGHAIGDFALQSDAMARGKNRHAQAPDFVPPGQRPRTVWPYYMTAHALVHAGIVWFITGNVWLALAELVSHWIIDFLKCESKTNPHEDQFLHFMSRICYAVLAVNWQGSFLCGILT